MSDEFESVGEGLRSRSLLADHGTSGPVPVRSGPHHVPVVGPGRCTGRHASWSIIDTLLLSPSGGGGI